ncbi:MAG TPA: isopentenyl-diphosphate Delta-isomerase [Lacibacter sp.]|nr:isopentenyl-diphosphate Delta-isomerase [Lacibacter sp.]
MTTNEVILVNEQDEPVGTMEKIAAHEQALLHRAFSIFIFNGNGEMLLQQRAMQKYHSPGLWTNACCSHPFPGEDTGAAATRRLQEELGFTTPLQKAFHFTYKAHFDNGLTEHEFDHVYTGTYDGPMQLNPDEVNAVSHQPVEAIAADLQQHPERYTAWFAIAFPRLLEWMKQPTFTHAR